MVKKQPTDIVALLVGDAHESDRSFVGRSDMVGDPQFAIEQAISLAIKLKATSPLEYVVFAGDLLDSKRPSSSSSLFLRKCILRLAKHDIKFAFIQGNHDYCEVPWPKALHNVTWLDATSETAGPLRIYGLDYTPPELLQEALNSMPECDVFVCHQRWDEFAGAGMGDASLQTIPYGRVRLVFTGDTHQYRKLDVNDFKVVSPGATHLRKSDEPDRHWVFGLRSDCTLKPFKLRSRRVLRVTINTEEDLLTFLDNRELEKDETLPESLQTPMVVVSLGYLDNQAKRRVKLACRGRAHLFWSKAASSEYVEEVEDVGDSSTSSEFLSALRTVEDKAAVALVERLWLSSNPKQELEQIVKEKDL